MPAWLSLPCVAFARRARAPHNGPTNLLSDCAELARTARSAHEAGHAVAALTFGIPIISVTIAEDKPHLRRGRYRAHDEDFGLEAIVTLCMSGPISEEFFCGAITDGSDQTDYDMARRYLARRIADPLQAAAELSATVTPPNAWSVRRGHSSAFACSPTRCCETGLLLAMR